MLLSLQDKITISISDEADISENSRSDQLAILIHVCRCLVQHTPQLQQLLNPRDRSKYSASSSEMYQCIVSAKCVLLQRYGAWVSDVVTEKLSTFLKSGENKILPSILF